VTENDTDTVGTPRWAKVLAIIAFVLVLLFVISLLTGVRHGPGRHTPPASVTGVGMQGP
jgi:hypothetical protein